MALGSLTAILTHPDECGPVPGPGKYKKEQPEGMKAAVGGDKAVEIGQVFAETVADSFDADKGNAAHGPEASDGGRFHFNQGCAVGCGEAQLAGCVFNPGTGDEPEFVRRCRGGRKRSPVRASMTPETS